MTIEELIAEIAASGVVLSSDGTRVRWSGPLPKPLLAALKRRERAVAAAMGELPSMVFEDTGFGEDELA